MIVRIAVAQTAAIGDHRVIEQSAVAIRGGLQLRKQIRELLCMEAVDLRYFLDLFLIALVMREPVVRFRDSDLRIGPRTLLASNRSEMPASSDRT